ncbi:MAG: hypothetical protein U0893_00810 [Chloroflexota bacterium]
MTIEREPITDEDWLYRRLGIHNIRQADGSVHYNAFQRRSDPRSRKWEPDPNVSVDLARLTTPEKSLIDADRANMGIGAIEAGFPRALAPGQIHVMHTPDEAPIDRPNPAHASIKGNEGEGALDRCHLMAEEMSKHVKIYPVGTPWRTEAGGAAAPGD